MLDPFHLIADQSLNQRSRWLVSGTSLSTAERNSRKLNDVSDKATYFEGLQPRLKASMFAEPYPYPLIRSGTRCIFQKPLCTLSPRCAVGSLALQLAFAASFDHILNKECMLETGIEKTTLTIHEVCSRMSGPMLKTIFSTDGESQGLFKLEYRRLTPRKCLLPPVPCRACSLQPS